MNLNSNVIKQYLIVKLLKNFLKFNNIITIVFICVFKLNIKFIKLIYKYDNSQYNINLSIIFT